MKSMQAASISREPVAMSGYSSATFSNALSQTIMP